MESKMRVIVENEGLRNVIKENQELRSKLFEFSEEKIEIDGIKDTLREVYKQVKGEVGDDLQKMGQFFSGVLKKNAEMKQELIKEKQEKLERVVWNVEVMKKRLKIQEKSKIIDSLHRNMENKLQGIEKELKALKLVIAEDLQSREGDKQLKRDSLGQLVEKVRDDLVSKMEDGIKGVTRYVQEVMENGGSIEAEKEIKKLKTQIGQLEEKLKEAEGQKDKLEEDIGELQKQNEKINKNRKLMKSHLLRYQKEKKDADDFVKKMEAADQTMMIQEEIQEKRSTYSEDQLTKTNPEPSPRDEQINQVLLKFQTLIATMNKDPSNNKP
jgi:chromosome segregation ATPase